MQGEDGAGGVREQGDREEGDTLGETTRLTGQQELGRTDKMPRNASTQSLKLLSRSGSRERKSSTHTTDGSISPMRRKARDSGISINRRSNGSSPFSSSTRTREQEGTLEEEADSNTTHTLSRTKQASRDVQAPPDGSPYRAERQRAGATHTDAAQRPVCVTGRSHSFDLSLDPFDTAYRAMAPRPSCMSLLLSLSLPLLSLALE